MKRIIIELQYMENYGYRWKMKGSVDFSIRVPESCSEELATKIVHFVLPAIEWDNEASRAYYIGHEFAEHSYSEKLQLEFEGKIDYPATEITL